MALTRVINEGIGSASAIAGEGTATTNLQQGLAKSWIHVANNQSINDSLSNLTSVIEANDETLSDLTISLQNNIDDGAYADGYTAGEVAGVASQAETIAELNADLQAKVKKLELDLQMEREKNNLKLQQEIIKDGN